MRRSYAEGAPLVSRFVVGGAADRGIDGDADGTVIRAEDAGVDRGVADEGGGGGAGEHVVDAPADVALAGPGALRPP